MVVLEAVLPVAVAVAMLRLSSLIVFVLSVAALPLARAVGTPFGQAAGTTGGGNASPQTPSSLAELTNWLSDGAARVIVLDRVWDFTSSEGTRTGTACRPWTCSPNPQLALDSNGCEYRHYEVCWNTFLTE